MNRMRRVAAAVLLALPLVVTGGVGWAEPAFAVEQNQLSPQQRDDVLQQLLEAHKKCWRIFGDTQASTKFEAEHPADYAKLKDACLKVQDAELKLIMEDVEHIIARVWESALDKCGSDRQCQAEVLQSWHDSQVDEQWLEQMREQLHKQAQE